MCFGLESTPRLQYKLSKVNYSPTTWGLVSHLSTYESPRMPHVSPGWGFPVTSALRLFNDVNNNKKGYLEKRGIITPNSNVCNTNKSTNKIHNRI